MRKLNACGNPTCRKRKILCWVTSAQTLSPHAVNLPIHSTEDFLHFLQNDGRSYRYLTQ